MDNPQTESRARGPLRLIHWIYNPSDQWRHGYLLLLGIFVCFWRLSVVATIPMLDMIRFGGLHPGDVLFRMQLLSLLWIPTCALGILYILSFALESLNTAEAIAKTALVSSVILALFLLVASIPLNSIVNSSPTHHSARVPCTEIAGRISPARQRNLSLDPPIHERIAGHDFGDERLHAIAVPGDGFHQMIHHDFVVSFKFAA